jgi:hypothetical protein
MFNNRCEAKMLWQRGGVFGSSAGDHYKQHRESFQFPHHYAVDSERMARFELHARI